MIAFAKKKAIAFEGEEYKLSTSLDRESSQSLAQLLSSATAASALSALTHLPPSVEEQTRMILTNMFHEAASLRNASLFTTQSRVDRGVTVADLKAVLQIRKSAAASSVPATAKATPKATPSTTSDSQTTRDVCIVHTSKYRSQWLDLILSVIPQPFESIESLPTRRHPAERPPVKAIFESELDHAHSVRTARATLRASLPIGHDTSSTLHHPPVAPTAAASFPWTQPRIRTREVRQEERTKRQQREAKTVIKADEAMGAKKRRLKNIARALEIREAEQLSQQQQQTSFDATQSIDDGVFSSSDEDVDHMYPYSTDADTGGTISPAGIRSGAATSMASVPLSDLSLVRTTGEQLNAPQLSFISFRTRDEYQAVNETEQLKSASLDYRQDSSAQREAKEATQGEGEEDDEEDLLTQTLRRAMAGTSGNGSQASKSARTSRSYPNETPQQRVQRMLRESRQSIATSGQFKLGNKSHRDTNRNSGGENTDPSPPTTSNGQARWVNPNDASAKSRPRPHTPEVRYDDTGRPIRTARRHAMDERLTHHTGTVPLSEERRAIDAADTHALVLATDRVLATTEITEDPLDRLLHPFVQPPLHPLPTPSETIELVVQQAIQQGHSTRRSMTSRSVASAPGPSTNSTVGIGTNGATSQHADWIRPSTSRDGLPHGKPEFQLHFHLSSPQDERLDAATRLSVFRTSDGAQPTIANGGITQLAQLKKGVGMSAIMNMSTTHAERSLTRDGSVGDISLLAANSFELKTILARQRLERSRPPFRTDFVRHSEHTRQALEEAHVIARDGGLTTAADGEAWRAEQLGWSLNKSKSRTARTRDADANSNSLLHAHTNSRVVRTNHLAPGSHTVRHTRPFTTLILGRSPLDDPQWQYSRLEQSEREAQDKDGQQRKMRQRGTTKASTMTTKPKQSERGQLKEEEEKANMKTQFPFKSLYTQTTNGAGDKTQHLAQTARW